MAALQEEMRYTYSVCPVCLKRIPAERVERADGIDLVKTCPEHGTFSSVIWRNRVDFSKWRGSLPPVGETENLRCPTGCGLCPDHQRNTCCTLLEITDRCNLNCAFCFADPSGEKDPSLEQVKRWIDDLTDPGKTLLQLSGGEPTVREDLPEIVAYAKQAGCKYVQLNSNGLRLAEEPEFVRKLAEAGLSFVFLQFDGVDDGVYRKLRNRPLLDLKKRAIENCGRCGIGVTLVPVIVPGVNTEQIGEILRFAVACSPYVRGVHFQPVSYFGRVPQFPRDEDRYTLDQLMEAVACQSNGMIALENLAPSCCDHPLCGFHGDFVVLPDGSLMPLTRREKAAGDSCCGSAGEPAGDGCCQSAEQSRNSCCGVDPAEKNREFVGRRWERRDLSKEGCCCSGPDMSDMEDFLARVRSHGFTVTAMAFQDAGNLDIERLRQCSLHVYREGRWIPFCACYLSPMGAAAPGGEV